MEELFIEFNLIGNKLIFIKETNKQNIIVKEDIYSEKRILQDKLKKPLQQFKFI